MVCMEEEHIIGNTTRSDTKAFEELVRKYSGMVYCICSRILCDTVEAEDAVQETFMRAWASFPKYDRRHSVATWLRTIACRLCYDMLRKRRYPYVTPAPVPDTDPGSEERLIWMESLKELHQVTKNLSPKQKTVFVLHEIEGMDYGEIKRITGFTSIQIKSNLYLARRAIRSMLENIME